MKSKFSQHVCLIISMIILGFVFTTIASEIIDDRCQILGPDDQSLCAVSCNISATDDLRFTVNSICNLGVGFKENCTSSANNAVLLVNTHGNAYGVQYEDSSNIALVVMIIVDPNTLTSTTCSLNISQNCIVQNEAFCLITDCKLSNEKCGGQSTFNSTSCTCDNCKLVNENCGGQSTFNSTTCTCDDCKLTNEICGGQSTFNSATCTCDDCKLRNENCGGQSTFNSATCTCDDCKLSNEHCGGQSTFNSATCTCDDCELSNENCSGQSTFNSTTCTCDKPNSSGSLLAGGIAGIIIGVLVALCVQF